MENTFPTGTRVKHSKFGLGIVKYSTKDRIEIEFDEYGLKRFVAAMVIPSLRRAPKGSPPPPGTTARPGRSSRSTETVPIVIDPDLSPEQIIGTLSALANYYRVCGGVGLSVDFTGQEEVVEEPTHV